MIHRALNRQPQGKKRILLAATAVILVGGAATGYWYWQRKQQKTEGPPPVGTISGINYNPPTDEEQKQADENKKNAEERSKIDSQPTQPGQTRSVNVTITSLNQNGGEIEMYAYVSGVVEEGGTCTATFKKDGQTITKTSKGIQDATTTICTPIRFSSSELAKGTWKATLAYSSATAQGNSNEATLEVK